MKNVTILFFLLIIFSCKEKCNLSYEIVDKKFSIPFVAMQNEMIRLSEQIDYDKYELVNIKESEIPYIMDIIKSKAPLHRRATKRMKNQLCDYGVQIAGFFDVTNKTKKVYLNFHYNIDFTIAEDEIVTGNEGKETKFDIPNDGGDYYFQAIIDINKNTFNIIYITGES